MKLMNKKVGIGFEAIKLEGMPKNDLRNITTFLANEDKKKYKCIVEYDVTSRNDNEGDVKTGKICYIKIMEVK